MNFNVLLLVIVVHVVAVVFYLLFKRENLIAPMLTGLKNDTSGSVEPIGGSKLLVAGITLLAAAAAIYGIVTLL